MLKYQIGFAALVAGAIGCVAWIAILVTEQPDLESGTIPASGATHGASSPAVSQPDKATAPDRPLGVPKSAESGRVVRHVDGDTLHIAASSSSALMDPGAETTVRLLEIDTPESVDPSQSEQCYAERASKALREMLPIGAAIWVKGDRELLDPYGRTLLYVWTDAGEFVNLDLVREGYAKAVLYEPNDEYIGRMRQAEAQARAAGRGVWGKCAFFGQPLTLMGQSASATVHKQPRHLKPARRTDPRFQYCSDANEAGYGDYVSGRDPEYDWYDDADHDGVVCET